MPKLTRRDALRSAAAPLFLQPASRRPWNILWISCEDTSPDLGCYGDLYAITPNLDQLAAQSARYTNAFSVFGVCAPSRSSIITGQYPTAIGTSHMRSQGVPPPETRCFPEYLRAAGYYCTNNVKTDYNFDPPVTAWDECTARAHWRNRPDQRQPFFAVMNYVITHESQIRAPEDVYQKNTARLTPSQRHDPAKAVLPPYYPDTPAVRRDWARMHDNITALDYIVGETLRQLEDDGLADSTVVFFWGDHGRGLPRAKRWIYDSGIRVPLLVRWPGQIQPGSVTGRMVSLMDLGPSALSVAGLPTPAQMHGKAFLGPQSAAPRKYVYAARDRMDETPDCIRGVRDSRYKYIRNYRPNLPYAQFIEYMEEMPTMKEWRHAYAESVKTFRPELVTDAQRQFFASTKPTEELYDCQADPHEIKNLAADRAYKAKLEELRAAHEQWLRDYPDVGQLPEQELVERMRPGRRWQTAAPVRIEVDASSGTAKATLSCPTPGASIAWTTEPGDKPRWQLYSKPLTLTRSATVRAVACRLGFKDSIVTSQEVVV